MTALFLSGRPVAACLVIVLATLARAGFADDEVVLVDGGRIKGAIQSLTPDGIEIENAVNKDIRRYSVTEVREVRHDGEPGSLADARGLLFKRDARGALAELAKIEPDDVKDADPRVKEEYQFVKLVAAARAAATVAEGTAAAAALKEFLANNLRTFHFYEGQETLAELLAKLRKYDDAAAAYGELDRGPPALRIRSASGKARLLLLQGKAAAAIGEFEAASRIETDKADTASAAEKSEAELGMARCLARMGKATEAVKAAKQTIRKANPNDRELLATAFVTLGECQRAARLADEEALVSYLTVDLVFNGVPELHAEALYNLVQLWEATKQPERAREARQALLANYPQSSWAKKLGDGGAS